jgi:hypothetical protein
MRRMNSCCCLISLDPKLFEILRAEKKIMSHSETVSQYFLIMRRIISYPNVANYFLRVSSVYRYPQILQPFGMKRGF